MLRPIAIALLLAAGCHGKSSAAEPELPTLPDDEPGAGPGSPLLDRPPADDEATPERELARRAGELLRGLAGELRTAGTECTVITERVNTFSLARQADVQKLRHDLAASTDTVRDAVEAELSQTLASELAAIRTASEACPDADWDLF